jgi:hypothetical protein
MKTYIAGPMSGIEHFNYPAFHAKAVELRAEGRTVLSPAEGVDDTSKPWDFYMRRALLLLVQCDAIYMLAGWKASKGARLEHHIAEALGMVIEGAID